MGKLFEKYAPNMHMLIHLVFECLGYDRITSVTIEGCAELKNILDEDCFGIGYKNGCIPRIGDRETIKKVQENGIGYSVDQTSSGQGKHYLNVGWDLCQANIGSNLHRHAPFQNQHSFASKVWVSSQNPMDNILKRS